MAEIVNLRRARKAKARADASMEAEHNRAKHGRTKREKDANEAEADRARRLLDGARRD